MPSAEHESPVELTRIDPGFVGWLLNNLFGARVPDYDHARPHAADVRVMVPRTYHADSMTLFCDAADRPLLATVLEVQRGWDITKRRTWKLYAAQVEAELDVDSALLAYCPNPAIADRYRTLFESEGVSLFLRPFIFTPDDVPVVVDLDVARANPTLTVLSAVCHGDDAEVGKTFPALVAALRAADPETFFSYYDVVLAGLPLATRTRWEAFVTTTAEDFQSELLRNMVAKYQAEYQARGEAVGQARGKALGKAEAILDVLDRRGVAVPNDVRDRVLECTDTSLLGTWLDRAITATTVDDVIRE